MYTSLITCVFLLLAASVFVDSLSCNFDVNFCDWSQSHDDQFDWKLGRGYTNDPTSGPRYDHTSGSGQYAYISGRDSANATSLAILQSPQLYVSKTLVLAFWYHMNGVGIGKLSVLEIDKYGREKEVWSRNGRQGPEWNHATISLDLLTSQVKFVASAKLHYSSDLAIDDIAVNAEPVEITSAAPRTTKRIEVPLGCDFEQDLCLWQQVTTDQLNWHRIKGQSPDYTSGIYGDHTTGNGHYIALVGHEAKNSSWSAVLTSPLMVFDTNTRMAFRYHMNGIGTGQLSVHRQDRDGTDSVIWSRDGRQGPDWILAEVFLYSGTFKITFEGSARYHYGSDIGLDDISFQYNPVAIATQIPLSSVVGKSFREKLSELLKCNVVQYGIIILVIIDSLIVVFELLIDMDFIELPDDDGHVHHGNHHPSSSLNTSHVIQHDNKYDNTSLPEPNPHHNRHRHHLVHESTTSISVNYTTYNNHTSDHVTGSGHHGHSTKEQVEHILHYASLTILSIFVVEVGAKIYAERLHLLKHKAEVFDSIVVTVSFTLDIVFSFIKVTDAARDAAGLMVLLRMWRITRIINGVIISIKMDADKKIEEQKHARATAEAEVEKLRRQVEDLQHQLRELQEKLRIIEGSDSSLDKCDQLESYMETCDT